MLRLGNRSYSDWIRHGTVSELLRWLGQSALTPRQRYNSLRIKAIMGQLVDMGFGDSLLFKPAPRSVYDVLVSCMVQKFTHMPLLVEK